MKLLFVELLAKEIYILKNAKKLGFKLLISLCFDILAIQAKIFP